jgi:hypothetical protein
MFAKTYIARTSHPDSRTLLANTIAKVGDCCCQGEDYCGNLCHTPGKWEKRSEVAQIRRRLTGDSEPIPYEARMFLQERFFKI